MYIEICLDFDKIILFFHKNECFILYNKNISHDQCNLLVLGEGRVILSLCSGVPDVLPHVIIQATTSQPGWSHSTYQYWNHQKWYNEQWHYVMPTVQIDPHMTIIQCQCLCFSDKIRFHKLGIMYCKSLNINLCYLFVYQESLFSARPHLQDLWRYIQQKQRWKILL